MRTSREVNLNIGQLQFRQHAMTAVPREAGWEFCVNPKPQTFWFGDVRGSQGEVRTWASKQHCCLDGSDQGGWGRAIAVLGWLPRSSLIPQQKGERTEILGRILSCLLHGLR